MASERQIAANQRNASLSTGPTTAEGKAASRENAVKHGLSGAGLVLPPDDAEAVLKRADAWRVTFQPCNELEEWYFQQVVVESVRIDACRRNESDLLGCESGRASLCWNEDRRLEAEQTAAGLSKRPALVVRKLQRTAQGCDWMIERWEDLAACLDVAGEWTEIESSLALDLLGTPREFRANVPWGPDWLPSEVAANELRRLKVLEHEALIPLDRVAREAAALGRAPEPSKAMSRLRRYETACHHRFQAALEGLANAKAIRPSTAEPCEESPPPASSPATSPQLATEPTIKPSLAPSPAPTFRESTRQTPRPANRRARRAAENRAAQPR